MRTDMSILLPNYFARLGKKVTPDNVAELSHLAMTNLAIFQFAFVGGDTDRNRMCARDLTDMYLYAHNIQWWDLYSRVVHATFSKYDVATFQNKTYLQAIFVELENAHRDVNKLLTERGIANI